MRKPPDFRLPRAAPGSRAFGDVSSTPRGEAAGSTLIGEIPRALVAGPRCPGRAAELSARGSAEGTRIAERSVNGRPTRMGWSQRPGDRLAADDLIRGTRVPATRTRWALLEILEAEGCLRREKQWEVLSELPGGDLRGAGLQSPTVSSAARVGSAGPLRQQFSRRTARTLRSTGTDLPRDLTARSITIRPARGRSTACFGKAFAESSSGSRSMPA